MNDNRICEQISFLRRQKGITQETLARHFGVTNQTVSKWESGQCYPDIQLLPQIADYFGISVDELMGHTPAASLEALCLTLKKYFTDLPEAKCFDEAYRLAAQLHEIVISAGYKRQISWKEKDYAKGCSGTWGLSAWSDTEGQAVREGNVILFADNRAWNKKKKTEIRKNACMLELFGDEKVLKILFALQELTAAEPDRYASAEEIAKAVKTETAEAEKILSELPVSVQEGQEEERYRIEGYAAWIPAILAMIH